MRDASLSLLFNWAALMALSLVLAFAADVTHAASPGAVWIVVIAGVAALKSRVVLRSYLGLSHAPGALAGFFTAVFVVLALVASSFLIFPTPKNLQTSANFVASESASGPAGAHPDSLINRRSN
jgi:hypothetical protein